VKPGSCLYVWSVHSRNEVWQKYILHFFYSILCIHIPWRMVTEILRNVGSIAYVYRASSLSRGSRFKIFVSIEWTEYVTLHFALLRFFVSYKMQNRRFQWPWTTCLTRVPVAPHSTRSAPCVTRLLSLCIWNIRGGVALKVLYGNTKHPLSRSFITWQLVSTPNVGYHQAIIQEHEYIQKLVP
jgi:hypothetical protein